MEIRIKRIEPEEVPGDRSETVHTYLVVDNGTPFRITFRSNVHGSRLCLEDQEGFLYRDMDNNIVKRRVIAPGPGCGVSVKSDEPVEALSPWSVWGIIFAERTRETGEIVLAMEGAESACREPVILVNGKAPSSIL